MSTYPKEVEKYEGYIKKAQTLKEIYRFIYQYGNHLDIDYEGEVLTLGDSVIFPRTYTEVVVDTHVKGSNTLEYIRSIMDLVTWNEPGYLVITFIGDELVCGYTKKVH